MPRVCQSVAKTRGGHIQITQAKAKDFNDDLAFVEKLAETANCPVLFNAVIANDYHPGQSKRLLDWVERARAAGKPVYLQAGTVGTELTYTSRISTSSMDRTTGAR